jgi:tripeptide aminopeptidase
MYTVKSERITKTFVDLAGIPSPSWQEKEVMEYIIKRFDRLGGKSTPYKCGDSHNLLIKIPGNLKCAPLLLSGHMDTVVPCDEVKPVIAKGRITSDGTTVLGGDDKAAITMFIEAFEYIKENKISHGPVEILLSCAEELGLKGIKQFDLSLLNSRYGFVFDSSDDIGQIIIKAPFHSNMEISIKGKASHAGMSPEKGLNAINVISEIITRLPSGRIDEETTMNVGLISGGRATNIVAEEAICCLEVRSIEKVKMLKIEKEIKSVIKETCLKYKAKYKINRTLEYEGFKISPDEKIARICSSAMERIKIKPLMIAMGGGSDTNIINKKSGLRAINLSCGMRKIHSTEEYVKISDLEKGTRLVLSIIETVKEGYR